MRTGLQWGLVAWALAWLWPQAAQANCAFATDPRAVTQCTPEGCVVPLEGGERVPDTGLFFVPEDGGPVVPALFHPVDGVVLRVRAAMPLAEGAHRLTLSPQRSWPIQVVPPVGDFTRRTLTTAYVPTPQGAPCNDVFPAPPPPPPHVERESALEVRVDLGRALLPGSWVDVWLLAPGEAAPVVPDDVLDLPARAPTMVLEPDGQGAVVLALWEEQRQGADRVAVHVTEPSGWRSGVLVGDFSGEQGWFLACHCTRTSTPVGEPWALLLAAGWCGVCARRPRAPSSRRPCP